MEPLEQVFAAIDAANAQDPGRDAHTGEPANLLYGQRMSEMLGAFKPDAGEPVAIAARGQHIERWTVPRSDYPAGRAGYLRWRSHLKDVHARRLAEIMLGAGYDAPAIARVGQIVRKERLEYDPDAQILEDTACLVFLRFYAPEFFAKHEPAKVDGIIAKTWAKMSSEGQAAALRLPLEPAVAERISAALGRASESTP